MVKVLLLLLISFAAFGAQNILPEIGAFSDGVSSPDYDAPRDGVFDDAQQVVTSNVGWVIIYSDDASTSRASFEFDTSSFSGAESATLRIPIDVIYGSPTVAVYGFVGDGIPDSGDVVTGTLLASEALTDTLLDSPRSLTTVDFDVGAFVTANAAESYLGFRIQVVGDDVALGEYATLWTGNINHVPDGSAAPYLIVTEADAPTPIWTSTSTVTTDWDFFAGAVAVDATEASMPTYNARLSSKLIPIEAGSAVTAIFNLSGSTESETMTVQIVDPGWNPYIVDDEQVETSAIFPTAGATVSLSIPEGVIDDESVRVRILNRSEPETAINFDFGTVDVYGVDVGGGTPPDPPDHTR